MSDRTGRRHFMQNALLGTVGAGTFLSCEESTLLAAQQDPDQATAKRAIYQGESLPTGKVGKYTISRLLLGSNLIGGYAHSRDLLYVARLLREYNTEAKIFETLELAEQSGINTIQIGSTSAEVIAKYREERKSNLQVIANVDVDFKAPAKVADQVNYYRDKGFAMLYTHGMVSDRHVMSKEVDVLGKIIDAIHAIGAPAGIGSHSLETTIAVEKAGLNPDFYVKTFHSDKYWSATPKPTRQEWCWYNASGQDHDSYNDNMYCIDPERTAEFMKTVKKPWFAFKVMAAGAMSPHTGFNFAFQGGADFVIAGMFDWQVAEDVEIAVKALKRAQKRERAWYA